MADKSKIEWTEATWNPIVGCSVVSPGCTNCYAMRWAAYALDGTRRRDTGEPKFPHYAGTTRRVNGKAVWTGKVALAPEHVLTAPLRRRRPTTWFVNSMGDLFHESVPDEWIDKIFAVMALCPQHTFQVLTKRSARMRAYCSQDTAPGRIWADAMEIGGRADVPVPQLDVTSKRVGAMPLPNVWLGVSAEDQKRADERVPDLLATPAAVRFVSAEPLLGPIDFRPFGLAVHHHPDNVDGPALRAIVAAARRQMAEAAGTGTLDWIIVGGESGPNARDFRYSSALSIIQQCAAAGVACFQKQVGSSPIDDLDGTTRPVRLRDRKGGDPSEWPEQLRVREMPEVRLAA
jgi:protein gp37